MTDIFGPDVSYDPFIDDLEATATPESLRVGVKVMKPDYPLLAALLEECAAKIELLEADIDTQADAAASSGYSNGFHEGYLEGFRYAIEWSRNA